VIQIPLSLFHLAGQICRAAPDLAFVILLALVLKEIIMPASAPVSGDHIIAAVNAAKRQSPAYEKILEFYQKVFVAQEQAVFQVRLDPVVIGPELLAAKAKGRLPLIGLSEFPVDVKVSAMLIDRLCHIAMTDNPGLSEGAKILASALASQKIDAGALFSGLLNEDDALFRQVSHSSGIDSQALSFFIYNSLYPSIRAASQQLAAAYLNPHAEADGDHCPVCGSPPLLAVLEKESRRQLICSFCRHAWAFRRICCPFCGNTDTGRLQYFYSPQEPGCRVDLCDACRRYLKTIDAAKLERPFYPSLEQVVTLHLDLKAAELGYASAVKGS
jgi:FdhE protein